MNVLIILPNWLGDSVMATPAIELLCDAYPNATLTLVGSYVSIEALKYHPRCTRYYVDETNKSAHRLLNTYRFAKTLGPHDLAITFRNQIYSSMLLYLTQSKTTAARKTFHSVILLRHTPKLPRSIHLAEQYAILANTLCKTAQTETGPSTLYVQPGKFDRPTLGINPGATYGSAKRWYPKKFAAVAATYADRYNIILFGGPAETNMAEAITHELDRRRITNYTNLAGKTSIRELCSTIGALDLFITNDSGPMHVAAAYQIPTVAIFGPTRHQETSQWKNTKSIVICHEIECAPCMKRKCPLGHHKCMKEIGADEVIDAVAKLIDVP